MNANHHFSFSRTVVIRFERADVLRSTFQTKRKNTIRYARKNISHGMVRTIRRLQKVIRWTEFLLDFRLIIIRFHLLQFGFVICFSSPPPHQKDGFWSKI